MSDVRPPEFEGFERKPLKEFTEKAYLDYSMYVILDRALPHLGDGLKPVQRRIIYAMNELNLGNNAKHMKSARTIGDVLGKYHPHGDSACYEAMVLMAQPFSYRYPLVDGQGNWGSADNPKSFAAMRYTEARLAPYSEVLLSELGQGTVDYQPNYDGKQDEPVLLPARVPNVLLNGATGIAVGMATDIPPHNLREVVTACLRLLDDPKATVEQLCEHVKGPDYPTDAEIITPQDELHKMYETGHGSVRMRAVYEREDGDIIITALPHQVSGERIQEQVAAQMVAKKLPMVENINDESDHENPTRLVVTPRSNRVDVDALMLHLFATTDLERTYRVNMNMIGLSGRPGVKDLRGILREWLAFRTETVTRRLQYRLDKVNERLHLLEGLLIAFLNIDEVIRIIRTEEHPKPALIARFGLTDVQAEYVLNTRLRQLARLEEMKIRGEQDELAKEKAKLEKLLGSKVRLRTLIKKELQADAQKYGDDRRSPIVSRDAAAAIDETALTPSEPVTVVVSEQGWVRAAKGHEIDPSTLQYKAGDGYLAHTRLRSNQNVIFVDSGGRTYTLAAHSLPSARGQGEPLTGRLNPPVGNRFVAVIPDTKDAKWLFASDAGYGFVVEAANLVSKNKAGKAMLSVPKGAEVLTPVPVDKDKELNVCAVTNSGHLLVFPMSELPELAKGKGNKIQQIPPAKFKTREEFMLGVSLVGTEKGRFTVYAGKRHITLKASDLEAYAGERGRRGNKLPRGFQRVEDIEGE